MSILYLLEWLVYIVVIPAYFVEGVFREWIISGREAWLYIPGIPVMLLKVGIARGRK